MEDPPLDDPTISAGPDEDAPTLQEDPTAESPPISAGSGGLSAGSLTESGPAEAGLSGRDECWWRMCPAGVTSR